MTKKLQSLVLTGALILILLIPQARLAAQSAGGTVNNNYDIQLFTQEETLQGPLGRAFAYFNIASNFQINPNCYVDITYSNSQLILQESSFITLLLNGQPISSTKIAAPVPDSTTWRVALPTNMIKVGFNEIRVTTLQRTTDDPCRDLYNNANWVKIMRSSKLHLEITVNSMLSLSQYPFPYFDLLSGNPVRSDVFLPPGPGSSDVEAMLKLVSYWGSIAPVRRIDVNVSTANPNDTPGNQVVIGRSGGKAGDGTLTQTMRDATSTRLMVSGGDPQGLYKAASSLTLPEMIAQMESSSTNVTRMDNPANMQNNFGKAGLFTLNDLNFPQIILEGIFTQSKIITVKRPLRFNTSVDSYVKLFFYHSENLDRKQSLLTVYINGQPAGSAELNPENARGGELLVKIPESELDKSEWVLSLTAYHYMGDDDVDCGWLYNEAAWTVIEGRSEIFLASGDINSVPSLLDFPYVITQGNQPTGKIVMWLPERPTDLQLSLAAVIASRAAQVTRKPINFTVVMSNTATSEVKDASVVIAVGYPNEQGMWNDLKGSLLVKSNGNGGFEVDNKLNVINEDFKRVSVIQAGESPWNASGIVYAVMPSDFNGVINVKNALTRPERISEISGQVALITPEGRTVSLSPGVTDIRERTSGESILKKIPWKWVITGLIILALLVFLVRKLLQNRRSAEA